MATISEIMRELDEIHKKKPKSTQEGTAYNRARTQAFKVYEKYGPSSAEYRQAHEKELMLKRAFLDKFYGR
jgi:hypothetical protein